MATADSIYAPPEPNQYPPGLPPGKTFDQLDRTELDNLDNAIRTFLETRMDYTDPHRLSRVAGECVADLFREGEMWFRRQSRYGTGQLRFEPYRFDLLDPKRVPTPVINIIEDPLRNESARLAKPNYRPEVPQLGTRPDAKTRTGAELMQQAQTHSLEEMRWPLEFHKFCNHLPMYGGGWLFGFWDMSWDKTERQGVKGAVRCVEPGCEFKLASPFVEKEQAAEFPMGTYAEQQDNAQVTHCPTCQPKIETEVIEEMTEQLDADSGQYVPVMGQREEQREIRPGLKPFFPVDDEVKEADQFGRSFGQDIPAGEWKIECVDDRDMWLPRDGVEIKNGEWPELIHCSLKDLDWIRKRWDRGFEVRGESEAQLRFYHPWWGLDDAITAGQPNTNTRFVRYTKAPWRERDPETGEMKMNRGVSFCFANGKTLFYGPYMQESQTAKGYLFKRWTYTYTPFEFSMGGKRLHGRSLFQLLQKGQESINTFAAMIEVQLRRGGFQQWLATTKMELQYQKSSLPGGTWLFKPDPEGLASGFTKPEAVPAMQVAADVWRLLELYFTRNDTAVGRTESESGQGSPNISSGSHLEILAEESAEQRAQRLERIRVAVEEQFQAGAIWMAEFVRYPRKMWTTDDAGNYQQKVWRGEDMHGQTAVKVKPAPAYETAVTQRENMRMAVNELHSLDPANPKQARLINDALNLPTEITKDANVQIDQARREWQMLVEEPYEEPYVDPLTDSDADHSDQHGADMKRESWHDLEEEAEFKEEYLPLLENWQEPSPATDANGQPIIMGYDQMGQPVPQMQTPMDRAQLAVQQAKGTWPECLELRIFETLRLLVGADSEPGEPWPAGRPGDPRDMRVPLQRLLRGRAHLMSHQMRAEGTQAQVASGQPTLAAPDTAQTVSGMVPGPNAGAIPMQPQQPPVMGAATPAKPQPAMVGA